MWFDCRKMIIDNKILTWSTLSFYVKITTHGDFLFIKKKAKGNWYNVEIQKKVTFINIDNLPNRNEWTWLWISTPACLESVMVHILIEKKRFKSKFVVFFDIREQRSILTKQLVDDLRASVLQTHERGLKSSTYSHQNI